MQAITAMCIMNYELCYLCMPTAINIVINSPRLDARDSCPDMFAITSTSTFKNKINTVAMVFAVTVKAAYNVIVSNWFDFLLRRM